MALYGVHQGIREFFYSLHGLFNTAAPTFLVNDTANSSAIVPFANITQTAFNETVNQTVKMLNETLTDVTPKTFLENAADTTWNVLGWGYTTIGYAGSALQNLLYATDRGSFAIGKTSELGTDVLSVAKSLFVMTDALGVYLCNIYLQYGPETFGQIINAAEQKMKSDLTDPNQHPEGWGIATLILTAAMVVFLIQTVQNICKSQEQKNTEKLIASLGKMLELDNAWSLKNMILNAIKWTGMGFVGFSIASLVTPLYFVAAGAGVATPILVQMVSAIWEKFTNKADKKLTQSRLLDLVDALKEQGANEVMLGLLRARAIEATRDPQALNDCLRLHRALNSGAPETTLSSNSDAQVTVIRDLPAAVTFSNAASATSSVTTKAAAQSLASKIVDKVEPVDKEPAQASSSSQDALPQLSKSALKRQRQKAKKH